MLKFSISLAQLKIRRIFTPVKTNNIMKYLQNLSNRIEDANRLTTRPVVALTRALETYKAIERGDNMFSEEVVVDLNIETIKEALAAIEAQREILSQLYGEASVTEMLENK